MSEQKYPTRYSRDIGYTPMVMNAPVGSGPRPTRVHAIRNDTKRALCSAASFNGWRVEHSRVTCAACVQRLTNVVKRAFKI